MKILALDLSSPKGSIAWCEGEQEVFSAMFANDRKHSGLFFKNLQACLKQLGNPDRIVIGLGPGSYAGTRIAIATATGLSAASGASLVGIPSLCAIETDAAEYAVIGDARRGSFYFAQVRDRRPVAAPVLFRQEELRTRLEDFRPPIFATESLMSFSYVTVAQPTASILASIGRSHEPAAAPLEPIYLREPNITRPAVRPALANLQ